MKSKTSIFLLIVTTYFLAHYLQSHVLGPTWLRFHLKDLLLIPALILATEFSMNSIGIVNHVGPKEIISTIFYCTLAFEVLLPEIGMAFDGDWVDCGCYMVGGIVYYLINTACREFYIKPKTVEKPVIESV